MTKTLAILISGLSAIMVFSFNCTVEARNEPENKGRHQGGQHQGSQGGGGKQAPVNRNAANPHLQNKGNVSRTPSMSRTGQAVRQKVQTTPQSIPQNNQSVPLSNRQPVRGSAARLSSESSREQARQHLQQNKAHPLNKEVLNQRAKDFKIGFEARNRDNRKVSDHVRSQLQHNRPDHRNWFNHQFFDRHHYRPRYYDSRVNWWGAATWGNIVNWLPWGWNYPVYYESQGYPIYLTPDNGYPAIYVQSQPVLQAVQNDWLPIGVFVLGSDVNQAAVSSMFIQLALNRNGELAGTYYNALTDQTYPLEGIVDQETQQAVWELSDNPYSPTMSTGLYNLTQEATEARVSFPDGTEQTWVMLRLQEQ